MNKIVKILLIILVFVGCGWFSVLAQPDLPDQPTPTLTPLTMFSPVCMELMGETHVRFHVGYYSNNPDHFTFNLVKPDQSNASSNIPASFTTDVGFHMSDWFIDAYSDDSAYTLLLEYTDDLAQKSTLPINTWSVRWCDVGEFNTADPNGTPEPTAVNPIEPTPEAPIALPTPDSCPAWAKVGDTDQLICLSDLPFAAS